MVILQNTARDLPGHRFIQEAIFETCERRKAAGEFLTHITEIRLYFSEETKGDTSIFSLLIYNSV